MLVGEQREHGKKKEDCQEYSGLTRQRLD